MIAIDMKMPKNCSRCNFLDQYGDCVADYYGRDTYNEPIHKRPDWCPLHQVDRILSEHITYEDEATTVPHLELDKAIKNDLNRNLAKLACTPDYVSVFDMPTSSWSKKEFKRTRAIMYVVKNDESGVSTEECKKNQEAI